MKDRNDRTLGMTRAIISGAVTMLCCAAAMPVQAEVTGAQLKNLYGAELQVLGDVESIDRAHGVLLVAGQHVSVAKETLFSYNGVPVEDQASALQMIQPGDLLAVTGALDAPARSVSQTQRSIRPRGDHSIR